MEIRPILSATWRNKTGAVLIALQIAFTLAVIANALFIIYQRWEKIQRPTGMDTENIIDISNIIPGRNVNYRQALQLDLDALRNTPGVISATAMANVPLSGSGSSRSFYVDIAEDSPRTGSGIFVVDEHGLDTLGLKLVAGRNFTAQDVLWNEAQSNELPPSVILTQKLAERIFPDGNAVGQTIYSANKPATVIGVVERMMGSWVSWDNVESNALIPFVGANSNATHYVVRVEPGQADRLIPELEKQLRQINPRRVITRTRTFAEGAANSYRTDNLMIWVLLSIVCLLMLVTGVGIVGLAAFSVAQRTRQIGTRRALGARRGQVLRYFLVENGLITSIGLAIGVLLASLVNYLLVTHFELERLDWYYVPVGMALLWLLGQLAVMGPARRASRVSPAIATRTV